MKAIDLIAPNPDDLGCLEEIHRARAEGESSRLRELERRLSATTSANCHLAVYGSLAPGEANAAQLESISGLWSDGYFVTGDLEERGWGSRLGFPGLRWRPSGPRVAVKVFSSRELPSHWERLDEFEGAEYRRIVVPLLDTESVVGLANIYVLR
jgi:gamma-glutamylcyclotransferase (GGCT)/AIG2-like uncharacterized protein YtfP